MIAWKRNFWDINTTDTIFCSCYYRYLVIDYLHPLAENHAGIFVRKDLIYEVVDFKVFMKPFKKLAWLAVLVSSLLVASFIVIMWKIQNNSCHMSLPNCIKIAIITIKTNFGAGSFESLPNLGLESPKCVFLTAMLMGNVIWLFYNASLLSALITPKIIKPFDNLESMAKTNFK